ncbi:hypothetical protein [Halostella litorea]|uniref:hypothetical protein n=1 Tax=Halostella litorea TaxID=2528831 RepID=UPI00109263AB|nr:hypothetical protein [Halostella litorea]
MSDITKAITAVVIVSLASGCLITNIGSEQETAGGSDSAFGVAIVDEADGNVINYSSDRMEDKEIMRGIVDEMVHENDTNDSSNIFVSPSRTSAAMNEFDGLKSPNSSSVYIKKDGKIIEITAMSGD